MSNDVPITLTPSDIIGAVQRGLAELQVYLNSPAQEINVSMCVAHMERLGGLLMRMEPMQQTSGAVTAPNARQPEKRAN